MVKRIWNGVLLVLIAAWGAGCASSSITNLTPSELPRTGSGLYRVEAAWKSNQRTLDKESLEPVVIVGTNQYPMQPIPYAHGRYETMVPVAADQDIVFYHFKFNFLYNTLPEKKGNSRRSPEYRLDILPDGEL